MKQLEGVYENDKPTGIWRSWFSDGQLRKEDDVSKPDSSIDNANPDSIVGGDDSNVIELDDSVPAVEILPTPRTGIPELEGPDREEMEDITPLEFRDPNALDSSIENGSESPDSSSSGNADDEEGQLPEGFFDVIGNSG